MEKICPEKRRNAGKNNPMYGRKHTLETRAKMRKNSKGFTGHNHSLETIKEMRRAKIGLKNPIWKGDDAKYNALHDYVKWHKLKLDKCENCGKKTDKLDCANINGKYNRDLNNYEWLCRKCHMVKDGRMERLLEMNKNSTPAAKLKKEDVLRIRELSKMYLQQYIAKIYRVSPMCISDIIRNRTWTHI